MCRADERAPSIPKFFDTHGDQEKDAARRSSARSCLHLRRAIFEIGACRELSVLFGRHAIFNEILRALPAFFGLRVTLLPQEREARAKHLVNFLITVTTALRG